GIRVFSRDWSSDVCSSDLSELEAGDRLRLILQEVTVLGEFSRYAGVEAVEVVRGNDKPLRIYYYNPPTEGGYFDGTGRAPYEGRSAERRVGKEWSRRGAPH